MIKNLFVAICFSYIVKDEIIISMLKTEIERCMDLIDVMIPSYDPY